MSTPEAAASPQLALVSCPDADTARALAKQLVEARLAACVTVLPGAESVYRWQGQIEVENECLLLAKLPAGGDHFDALRDAVLAAHPYELPEIIAVSCTSALPAYAQWIIDETRLPTD